jgi:hypothetical protein
MESRTQTNKAIGITSSCLPEHKAGYEKIVKNAEGGQRSGHSGVTVGSQLHRLKIDCPYQSHLENTSRLANDA